MRQTITFDPRGRKEEYKRRAEEAGMSLSEWICSMLDRQLFTEVQEPTPVPAGHLCDGSQEAIVVASLYEKVTKRPYSKSHASNCRCDVCRK